MIKPTEKSANGTSFFGATVDCSVMQLKEIFGKAYNDDNDGCDKVNYEWILENENGDVVTIYDYKYYRPLKSAEEINWHIGGMSEDITEKAMYSILKLLNK